METARMTILRLACKGYQPTAIAREIGGPDVATICAIYNANAERIAELRKVWMKGRADVDQRKSADQHRGPDAAA